MSISHILRNHQFVTSSKEFEGTATIEKDMERSRTKPYILVVTIQ